MDHDKDVREYHADIAKSSKRLRKQLKLAGIATGSLLICAFATYLFLDVGPFHKEWQPYGEIPLFLTLGALMAALYYDLLAWGAWSIRRGIKKDLKELLEDRFGISQL